MIMPTRLTPSPFSARATNGQSAAPLSSVMNARRRISNIGFPPALASPVSLPEVQSAGEGGEQVLGVDLNRSESTVRSPWVRTGHEAVALATSAFPPRADIACQAPACLLCARSGHWPVLFDH